MIGLRSAMFAAANGGKMEKITCDNYLEINGEVYDWLESLNFAKPYILVRTDGWDLQTEYYPIIFYAFSDRYMSTSKQGYTISSTNITSGSTSKAERIAQGATFYLLRQE